MTNTYSQYKELHNVSIRHPQSHYWHQLDLVIIRHVDLSSVLHTYSHHSADCDIDSSLVATKVRLMPKKLNHSKTKGQPSINTCYTASSDRVQLFADTFGKAVENSTCDVCSNVSTTPHTQLWHTQIQPKCRLWCDPCRNQSALGWSWAGILKLLHLYLNTSHIHTSCHTSAIHQTHHYKISTMPCYTMLYIVNKDLQ